MTRKAYIMACMVGVCSMVNNYWFRFDTGFNNYLRVVTIFRFAFGFSQYFSVNACFKPKHLYRSCDKYYDTNIQKRILIGFKPK